MCNPFTIRVMATFMRSWNLINQLNLWPSKNLWSSSFCLLWSKSIRCSLCFRHVVLFVLIVLLFWLCCMWGVKEDVMRSVVGLFCIVEWRYLSISDANIQKSATRLQAIGDFLTFDDCVQMSVFHVQTHSMSFMPSSGIFHSVKAIEWHPESYTLANRKAPPLQLAEFHPFASHTEKCTSM